MCVQGCMCMGFLNKYLFMRAKILIFNITLTFYEHFLNKHTVLSHHQAKQSKQNGGTDLCQH